MQHSVPEISLDHLIDGLKAVHKTHFTNLAKSLESAANLRRSGSKRRSFNDHEWNMQLGHGYTRAQQANGSFKSALHRNRQALKKHFAAAAPVMQANNWHGLLNQCLDAISVYGINRRELEASLHLPLKDADGLLPDEAEVWASYTGSRKSLITATYSLDTPTPSNTYRKAASP